MVYATILALILSPQGPPPTGAPPSPQGNGQTLPGQQGPNTGQLPGGMQQPFGAGQNVMVDGTYQVLAYEKFGQILPGMNTLKVVIRNNVLIFPGDGKFPGKMLQLSFGPNNTVTIAPLGSTGSGPPPVMNNGQLPANGNTPGNNGQNATAQNNNAIPNQNGIIAPNPGGNAPGTETGVYVLSTEFFSISIINQGQVNGQGPIYNNTVPPVTPGQNQPALPGNNPVMNGQLPGNGIIANPRTGGTDAPKQPVPPTQPGGPIPPVPGQPNPVPPTTGGPTQSSATLVLRKIVN
ncbi:MAG: hypothetical protein QM703_13785 [Gemmatales bacterium]